MVQHVSGPYQVCLQRGLVELLEVAVAGGEPVGDPVDLRPCAGVFQESRIDVQGRDVGVGQRLGQRHRRDAGAGADVGHLLEGAAGVSVDQPLDDVGDPGQKHPAVPLEAVQLVVPLRGNSFWCVHASSS